MSSDKQKITAVPTNIITGFLGVGKTSAILHLLKNKPANEHWAVLVNEFGEIGVDGSFLQGKHTEKTGVFIQEVPGGCMCCAAGVPMRVALNQLLKQARPDRLLIEPTGLGHPVEVLKVLSDDYYHDVLSIQNIVTLVDARQLSDPRYTDHETFNQQIAIADIIVGNKQDLYQQTDHVKLDEYIKAHGKNQVNILVTEQGAIDAAFLEGATTAIAPHSHQHDHDHDLKSKETIDLDNIPIPERGYVQAINRGEGFESIGWRFSANKVFNREKLFAVLISLNAERVKGVFITDNGIVGYNIAGDSITEIELDDCQESRVEIIALQLSDEWGRQLMECIL